MLLLHNLIQLLSKNFEGKIIRDVTTALIAQFFLELRSPFDNF